MIFNENTTFLPYPKYPTCYIPALLFLPLQAFLGTRSDWLLTSGSFSYATTVDSASGKCICIAKQRAEAGEQNTDECAADIRAHEVLLTGRESGSVSYGSALENFKRVLQGVELDTGAPGEI